MKTNVTKFKRLFLVSPSTSKNKLTEPSVQNVYLANLSLFARMLTTIHLNFAWEPDLGKFTIMFL